MYSYVTRMYSYITRMYSYVTRILFVCTGMLLVCTRMLFVCTGMLLVCTRMLLVCSFSHDLQKQRHSFIMPPKPGKSRFTATEKSRTPVKWRHYTEPSGIITEAESCRSLPCCGLGQQLSDAAIRSSDEI